MQPVIIAAMGNESIQDEAAALYLLHKIKTFYPRKFFKFCDLGNQISNLLKYYEDEENVLIITTGYLNKNPGDYEIYPLKQIRQISGLIGINPQQIKLLFKEKPILQNINAWVLAIQAHWNEWGDELSPEISSIIKQIFHIFWHILETLDLIHIHSENNKNFHIEKQSIIKHSIKEIDR